MTARSVGEVFGMISISRGFGSLVAPIIAGLLYHPANSMESQINTQFGFYGLSSFVVYTGSLVIAALTLVCFLEVVGRRRRNELAKKGEGAEDMTRMEQKMEPEDDIKIVA
jgi:hypothetical protein